MRRRSALEGRRGYGHPVPADPGGGLTSAEVAERVARGQVNVTDDRSTRTLGEILRANVLTRFNAIVASLGAIVVVFGDLRDALFALVMVSNAVIGTAQEWRSKRTLDRLALVSTPAVRVWRDGQPVDLAPTDVVLDDVFEVGAGDQVAVDAEVVATGGMSVDESLLTGEADAVAKSAGDQLMSGSFVVAGAGRARATAVGDDAYAARLASEARRYHAAALRAGPWHRPHPAGRHVARRAGRRRCCSSSQLGGRARVVARFARRDRSPGSWPWCRRASCCCSAWPRRWP